MKADCNVPTRKLDRKERVIPRRKRFQFPGLVVCIRGFTEFVQKEEIFSIPILCASEKRRDSVFLIPVCDLSLNGCVQVIEARQDGVMVLFHQHTCIFELRLGVSSVSQKG